MNKNKLYPILVISIVAVCILALYTLRPEAKAKPSSNNAWRVSVQKAQLSPQSPQLTLIGQLESPRETTLASPSNAYVKQVHTEEGRFVEKGTLLVTLDPSDEALRLTQREADVIDLQAQIDAENNRYASDIEALVIEKELSRLSNKASKRYGNLAQRQVGSDVQWDDSKQAAGKQSLSLLNRELAIKDHPNRLARLKAQHIKVVALRDQSTLDLARTEIRAPFDARVTNIHISPQNRLRAGDQVLTLYDIDSIELRAQIPLKYLPSFETALSHNISIKGSFQSSNASVPISLSRLSGEISKGRGGIDGLFTIDNTSIKQSNAITIGRSLSINLSLPIITNSIAVPPQAMYGQDRIYTVSESVLVSHQINRLGVTTLNDGSPAFLIDGANIKEGSDILITQIPNAISGMEVQITQ
ncbi:hypothetical protein A9Q99_11950 [Gammaproteobacteria bacterium 45_16_T64]|nr:hypothetical protein A9Q99_11950 [Gammaproteobacteria bacterium 45_16_T64]